VSKTKNCEVQKPEPAGGEERRGTRKFARRMEGTEGKRQSSGKKHIRERGPDPIKSGSPPGELRITRGEGSDGRCGSDRSRDQRNEVVPGQSILSYNGKRERGMRCAKLNESRKGERKNQDPSSIKKEGKKLGTTRKVGKA